MGTVGKHCATPNGAFLRELISTTLAIDHVLTISQLLKDRAVWGALGIGFCLMFCKSYTIASSIRYTECFQRGPARVTSFFPFCE